MAGGGRHLEGQKTGSWGAAKIIKGWQPGRQPACEVPLQAAPARLCKPSLEPFQPTPSAYEIALKRTRGCSLKGLECRACSMPRRTGSWSCSWTRGWPDSSLESSSTPGKGSAQQVG